MRLLITEVDFFHPPGKGYSLPITPETLVGVWGEGEEGEEGGVRILSTVLTQACISLYNFLPKKQIPYIHITCQFCQTLC